MYISEISIKNYRNFGSKPFRMKLMEFTTIIGANNVGKTNLLSSIGLILSQDITMFRKRMLKLDDINYKSIVDFKKEVYEDSIPPNGINFPEVRIELLFEGMNADQQSIVGDWFSDITMSKAKLCYEFTLKNNFDKEEWIINQRSHLSSLKKEKELEEEELLNYIEFPINQYRYNIYGGNDSNNRVDPYFLNMLKLEFLDALRDADTELVANGEYKLLYRILNQDSKESYDDIKNVLQNLDKKVKENKKLNDLKKIFIKQLNDLSLQGTGENILDFSFSTLATSEILKKLSLIYGEDPISIERNGLGRNNLLYISLILSHLSPEEENDISFRVVGIEEPEAHLHPHLQKHLASNIESMNKDRDDLQVILTSHSTHISSSVKSENTVIIFNDDSEIKSHYITSGFTKDKKGQNHLKYLEKYLDATNSSMFFARRIILVEGIAEQILIPIIYKYKYNKSLDSIGCNIINVNGVAFRHFLEIIKNGYFIKCGVLTDGDLTKRTKDRASNLKEEYERSTDRIKITFNNETFEKELIEFNKAENGKRVMLNALERTRPQAGKTYISELEDKNIEVESFFELIDAYKSEFAFELGDEISSLTDEDFNIPDYILDVLNHVTED